MFPAHLKCVLRSSTKILYSSITELDVVVAADAVLSVHLLVPQALHLARVLVMAYSETVLANPVLIVVISDVVDHLAFYALVSVDPDSHRHVLQLKKLQDQW